MKAKKSKKSELSSGKIRAVLLFSGGLDSILAAKILEGQGIKVTALALTSYFFNADQAKESAKENNIKLKIADFSKEHFKIVKNPSFGRGSGLNPCVDCHLLMLKEAKKIAKKSGYDFIATGEVLGQRPMSQNLEMFELIEKKSRLERNILRPLSAKLLPITVAEEMGIIDRKKLYAFSGRSRKEQIGLAKKMGIKKYPSPAGGCILTDKEYSRKLKKLTKKIRVIGKSDIELLRIGRHFWVGKTRVIIGRNHKENLQLEKLAEKGDMLVELKGVPGPLALIRGRDKRGGVAVAKKKIIAYAKKLKSKFPEFRIIKKQ